MGIFDTLAEARIRDWQSRGRPMSGSGETASEAGGLEAQLLGEIVALRKAASATEQSDERERLDARARQLKIQLVVMLERSGRPLAAQAMETKLAARLKSDD